LGSNALARIAPLLEGQVYSFSRQTGAALWSRAVDVLNFGVALNQPSELPVLTFVTSVSSGSRGAGHTEVVCIDKRDGRAVLADKTSAQSHYARMEGKPANGTVEIKLQNRVYLVKFSNDPHAPSPPAVLDPGQPISVPAELISEPKQPVAAETR
jgi:hypothetical protein